MGEDGVQLRVNEYARESMSLSSFNKYIEEGRVKKRISVACFTLDINKW